MSKYWTDENILNRQSENTPTKEIFQAVCDAIGSHYEKKGWKYSRSRPKISFKNKEFKFEIAFWSSGSNMHGSYVNLEIIPSICSLELIKSKMNNGIKSNGYILGLHNMFSEINNDVPVNHKKVIMILDETKIFDGYGSTEYGIQRYNHNVNVYNITQTDFEKILDFIDCKILVWFEDLKNSEKLLDHSRKVEGFGREYMLNGEYMEFIKLKYPELAEEVESNLKNKR